MAINKSSIFALLAAAGLASSCTTTDINPVVIDASKTITTNFIGNGVQADPYPHADTDNAEWGKLMTQAKWDRVYKRLDYMQPRLIRIMDQANWRYLKGFDKQGNAILDFETEEEKVLLQFLDYCQENNITVLLGEWGAPFQVHDVASPFHGIIEKANDPRWVDMMVKHLQFLIEEKGYTCIKYYNIVNEPNGFWASTDGHWDEWKEGAQMLAQQLREKGLDKHVTIAGPDAVPQCDHPRGDISGMQWMFNAAEQMPEDLGALELHAYFPTSIIRNAEIDSIYTPIVEKSRQINKPIFFGEVGADKGTKENQDRVAADPYTSEDSYMPIYDYSYGIDMADAVIQIMNAGFHGAAAWDLDDAMHTKDDLAGKDQLKRWGFWNSLGTEICNNPADEEIRPWFFTWSLLCRYIESGATIVETTQAIQAKGVRVSTAVKGTEATIAVVNNSDKNETITISAGDLVANKALQQFFYIENQVKTDNDGFPVAEANKAKFSKDGKLEVVMPAHSFKLFTTYQN